MSDERERFERLARDVADKTAALNEAMKAATDEGIMVEIDMQRPWKVGTFRDDTVCFDSGCPRVWTRSRKEVREEERRGGTVCIRTEVIELAEATKP